MWMPWRLQRENGRHVRDVDADRLVFKPRSRSSSSDQLGEIVRDAGRVRHRAAHRRHPRAPARLRQPRAVELVVLGGGAEVPEDRVVVAGQEREADVLVALPGADRGARHVAQVVRVEQQQRAEVRRRQRRLRPREPVSAQTVEIDPLLPVDRHRRASRRDLHQEPPELARLFSDSAHSPRARQPARRGYRAP